MGRPSELEGRRRQTARLNLVISAPSTPVPVKVNLLSILVNCFVDSNLKLAVLE